MKLQYKRSLALFIGVCLIAVMLPITVLAADATSVTIGGVELSNNQYAYHDGTTLTATSTDISNQQSRYVKLVDGTLTLHNFTLFAAQADAIRCDGDLTITLEGTNSVTGGNSTWDTSGIRVEGGTLTINGSGKLTATGGTIISGSSSTCGISCVAFIMNGGTVTATGGSGGSGVSMGLYCSGIYGFAPFSLTNGSLTAFGGKSGSSFGAYIQGAGSVAISGGVLTATGGEATSVDSCGLKIAYLTGGERTVLPLVMSGGTLTAKGGTANQCSFGIDCDGITQTGGRIEATAGQAYCNGEDCYSSGIKAFNHINLSGSGTTLIATGDVSRNDGTLRLGMRFGVPPDELSFTADNGSFIASYGPIYPNHSAGPNISIYSLPRPSSEPDNDFTASVDYAVKEGINQTIVSGSAIQVRVDAPYTSFIAAGRIVYVDSVRVATSAFLAWEGSTYVKLLPAYTRTLTNGTHTLTIEFADGKATIPFTVDSTAQKNPATGANDAVAATAALALIAGAAGTVLLRRKK